jgi:hypothetical protein
MLSSACCNGEAESDMKIYLLVMLMSALLIAIRFTAREQQLNSPPSNLPFSQTSACAGSIFDVPCRRPSCCAGSINKLRQAADHASQD